METAKDCQRQEKQDGNGRQQCTECERRSIAGIVKGSGKCPYHWAAGAYGKKWADSIYR